MTNAERIQQLFIDSAQTQLAVAEELAEPISRAADLLVHCLMNGGKILACGNGASAADAQRLAAALINRYDRERPGLAAIALTTDSSTLTSIANDYYYAMVFARQVSAVGSSGDILVAISTSGNSSNVLEAVKTARNKGMHCVALTGHDGGDLAELLGDEDILICVPSDNPARIREVHLLTIHCLCDSIDYQLLGA
jgi:D-sedoheptulose 7-phosphate isomerase